MKIDDIRPQAEKTAQLDEQFFSIQDQGMIFDILRNKMYSNPIAAICREISCNARDAHREIGKSHVPIHIHLPNVSEPFFKVKDFGPGISPDRMSNIFIKYTASTKRSDNIQTGGFGLGAKTPFSYSDTFSIITNYNGKQYNYACFIDETKVGKLTLLLESDTTEENGTEIIVPIKDPDFRVFADQTEYCTRHWDVKPVIKGGKITWSERVEIIKGDNWLISQSSDWSKAVKLVVDGIEYPLDSNTLRTYAETHLIESSRGNLFMYFGVGELSLSASREQIYLDKPTQQKIATRLKEISSQIKKNTEEEITKCSNLREAHVYYKKNLQKAFQDLKFLGPLSWQGIPLYQGACLDIDCPVYTFTRGRYTRKYGTDPNKISRSSGRSIVFESNTDLYINDLGIRELTTKHVKKAFDSDPQLKSLQVITPTDKVSIGFLNTNYHLDKMSPGLLSSLTKYTSRSHTPSANRLIVYKFIPSDYTFKQVSYSSIDDDHNNKVLCLLNKDINSNFRTVVLNNNNGVNNSVIKSLLSKHAEYSFYGVDASTPKNRILEDFEDFCSLEDFIQEKVFTKSRDEYVGIKLLINRAGNVDESFVRSYSQLAYKIKDQNSVFLQRLNQHLRFSKVSSSDVTELNIFENVSGQISDQEVEELASTDSMYDLDSLNRKFSSTYPLLDIISSYRLNDYISHVIEYINLIDAKSQHT